MTPELQHTLWNIALEHAIDLLDDPSGPITLLSDRLDPDYIPVVEGSSFQLLSGGEIHELVKTRGEVELVRLSTYGWHRGPLTVRTWAWAVTRREDTTEPIAGTPWQARAGNSDHRQITLECRKPPSGWWCTQK
jgi:hypothetical protein